VLFETEAETLKDALEEAVELGVNLFCADLRNADLGGAYLADANLSNADFSGANLFNAVLWQSSLIGARFCNVGLRYADVRYAKLKKAVLRSSDLTCAQFLQSDLTKADFRDSDLEGAQLRGTNLTGTSFDPRPMAPEEGSFVAWKRVFDKQGNPVIATVLIPEEAQRTPPLVRRVCRAEFVKILELSRGVSLAKCKFYPDRIYYVDGTVRDVAYDEDVQIGCSLYGIHFYLTREEAEKLTGRWFQFPFVPVAEYWKSAIYRSWVDGAKCLNQPDNKESRW